MEMTGAELLVEALKREGVETIFGFPGGVVIPIFDVLYSEPSIHVVLTRHEQGAVHAADGYARSSGKVGVCLVTSGPGATNTVTGLATANFDSVPLVCFTGQVPLNMIGNDAFQEADTIGITRPITKHNFIVTERGELASIIKKAFIIASTGRPGPVVVDLPKDIILAKYDDIYPETVSIRGYNPVRKGHSGQIKRAAEILNQAHRPLFFIGGGIHISRACEIFRKIVKKTGVPVVTSLMGIGGIESNDPLCLGMLGMHGTYAANMAITECDLIFAIGVRFDDRATGKLQEFAPKAQIVHIDIDPAAIARNVAVAIPIVGDARLILEEIYPLLKYCEIDEWRKQVATWKAEHPVKSEPSPHGKLSPGVVIQKINEVFPDAIIATEVGQNQMWAALYYNFKHSRSLITSGGLGTMGFGFPAAIGAKLANPDKTVIDIAGDGSIQMNIQEMATAVQEGVNVIIAILNNGYLGMVRQWQELFFNRRYSATCLRRRPSCPPVCTGESQNCSYNPDFVKLAEAYQAVGFRVTKESEITPVLQEACKVKDRPVIIDFIIEEEANVWPMVPAGGANKDMMLGGSK